MAVSMADSRLPPPFGLQIDRSTPIHFSFDGHGFTGLQGDTIASALAANDQWLLSRSFKYHRPRGFLSLAGQDANTLVQLPANPNALADVVPITEGLKVCPQNFSGTLKRDRNALLGLFARFLPVAFYYKAFFRPRGIWQLWARFFRKRAGLGVIDESFEPVRFNQTHRHCEVLIVGVVLLDWRRVLRRLRLERMYCWLMKILPLADRLITLSSGISLPPKFLAANP